MSDFGFSILDFGLEQRSMFDVRCSVLESARWRTPNFEHRTPNTFGIQSKIQNPKSKITAGGEQ
jgi:hypothetical protein